MRVIELEKAGMASAVTEMRIEQAIHHKTPAAASVVHAPGDMLRVYRESDKRLLGPYRVVRAEGNGIYVDWDGRMVQFNGFQVIPDRTFTVESMMSGIRK